MVIILSALRVISNPPPMLGKFYCLQFACSFKMAGKLTDQLGGARCTPRSCSAFPDAACNLQWQNRRHSHQHFSEGVRSKLGGRHVA
ncbi:hypothetical protein C8Q78DRAFT_270230 [Trametes maxima]|nr:hypothetical protein C8Q78DRAFT_270230 [Trametes maxima]